MGQVPEGIDQRYTREELIQKLNELDAGGRVNMAEQYRFEDFTPEELGRLRQLYGTLGLDPLPIDRGEAKL
jgi:hypothetical protein